ncbi:MAG: hypothetical protein QM497_04985 [Sulfurimonas sp.]
MASILKNQNNLTIIFQNDKAIFTNLAFNIFFGVASTKEYNSNFGPFEKNFVPHPAYFNEEKIEGSETWFDAILKLKEIDRIVSILSQVYEPCAFSISINSDVEDFKIVTLEDITKSLIKRIMIQNHANIDLKSGAYAKDYFLQIMTHYEDAAAFNEKIVGLTFAKIETDESLDAQNLKTFVSHFTDTIRQDDMFVRWNNKTFLLVYLVDNKTKSTQVVNKIQEMVNNNITSHLNCKLTSISQDAKESLSVLINKIEPK